MTDIEKIGGEWCVTFSIGNQKFHLAPCEDKKSAQWQKEMLDKALSKYVLSIAQEAVEEEKGYVDKVFPDDVERKMNENEVNHGALNRALNRIKQKLK